MSKSQRRKGAEGEAEVVQILRASHWPRATRNFASGASGNGDIAHGPEGVVMECKRAERTQLWPWWAQVQGDAERAGAIPMLVTRRSRSPWLAVVELDEALALLALREGG